MELCLWPGVHEETDSFGRPVSRWSHSDAHASGTSLRRWSTWRWDASPLEVFPLTRAGGMGDSPRIGLLARRSSLLAAFPRPNASVADSQPLPADSCATAPDLHRLPVHPWAFHLYQQYMAPDETSMVWRVSLPVAGRYTMTAVEGAHAAPHGLNVQGWPQG